jgi:hypothetical protein
MSNLADKYLPDLLRTAKQKADHLKREIREKINTMLGMHDLSTAVGPLGKLRNAINSGNCKFVKLTAEERRERLEAYKAKIATGEMKARERKQRSDAGSKKRKSKAMVDDSESEDSHDPKHQRKAASDSSSSDSDSD